MFFLSLLHSYLYTNINWNDVKIIWLNEMCSRFILHDIFAWIFIENPSFCGSSHNNLVWSQHRFNIEQHVLFEYDYMLRQWCSVRVNKLCVFVYFMLLLILFVEFSFSIRTHAKKLFIPMFLSQLWTSSTILFIVEIAVIWPWVLAFLGSGFLFEWISSPIIQFI